MSQQQENNKNKKEETATAAEERGKKAIEAEKIAKGEHPGDPAVKEKEKKDAEAWRNEG
ncbi:MAG TPA: hypothetical protein VL307_12165 [Chitinophagaceae bacterium]|jgi:hypothetical protein|nr:hypothetical protein [Chitinophagaceae bacterium]